MENGISFELHQIIGLKNYNEIRPLFKDAKAMLTYKSGETWDDDKIKKYLGYIESEIQLKSDVKYKDWKIINGGKVIGMVGFEPTLSCMGTEFKDRVMVNVLIRSPFWNQGFGKRGVILGLKKYREFHPLERDIFAMTAMNNIRMNRLLVRIGFYPIRTIFLGGKGKYVIYRISLSDNF